MPARSAAQTSLEAIEWVSILATALALFNSVVLVWQHAVTNKHPLLQKYTLRILLMVPVYSLVSCISLWLHGYREVLYVCEIVRMLMEALAIFSFLQYILVAAGGAKVLAAKFDGPVGEPPALKATPAIGGAPNPLGEEDLERGGEIAHGVDHVEPAVSQSNIRPRRTVKHFPLLNSCLPPWRSARRMIRWCVRGTLTYVVVGGGSALVKLTFLLARVARHGEDLPGRSTTNTVVDYLIMLAQSVALTSLATLAVNMMEDLEHIRPRAKFLSVKIVVFFTFWQGLLLQFLARQGCLSGLVDLEHDWWDEETVAFGFQNLLICIEMCVVSIFHFWIWQPHDFLTILAHLHIQPGRIELIPEEISRPSGASSGKLAAAGNVANFKDILVTLQDVRNSEFKRHRADSCSTTETIKSECKGCCCSQASSEATSESGETSQPLPSEKTASTTALGTEHQVRVDTTTEESPAPSGLAVARCVSVLSV